MIELAPRHKIGLPVAAPVMPAAGFWGYGQNRYAPLIDAARFGALVTNPITLRPRRTAPAITEVSGGVIFHAPPGNFGVKKIIRAHKKFWRGSPVPVIAHLPADAPDDLRRTARALESTGHIAAFEIGFTPDDSPGDIRACLHAVMRHSELPLLAKIPAAAGLDAPAAALDAGADALVLAVSPPAGAVSAAGEIINGEFFGLGIVPGALPAIARMRATFPDVPLIAGGGIHTPAEAQMYLRAGATAVQLDTIIFINPMQVQKLLEALA